MKPYKIILFFTLITFCFVGNVKAQQEEETALLTAIKDAEKILKPLEDTKVIVETKIYSSAKNSLQEINTSIIENKSISKSDINRWVANLNYVIKLDNKEQTPKKIEGILTTVNTALDAWYEEYKHVLAENIDTLSSDALSAKNKKLKEKLTEKEGLIVQLEQFLATSKEEAKKLTQTNLQNTILSSFIALVIGIILCGLLFYFIFYKKQKNRFVAEKQSLLNQIEDMKQNTHKSQADLLEDVRKLTQLLKQEQKEKEEVIRDSKVQLDDLEKELKETKKSQSQQTDSTILPVTNPVKIVSVPRVNDNKHFWAEALVTAGPRKNFGQSANEADFGLGEDTAGVIVKNEYCFFWVLDGTSDADILKTQNADPKKQQEYFSSRLLAQTISWNLHTAIEECKNEGYNSAAILEKAIKLTYQDWEERFDKLSQEDKNYISSELKQKNMLQCSTTALFGILDISGRLDVCRIGDSRFIALPNHKQQDKLKGAQYITIVYNHDRLPTLNFTNFEDTRYTTEVLTNVDSVLAMTDGVSDKMNDWLSKVLNSNFSNEKIRKELANFKQETNDDKALCIIQIKG